MQIKLQSMIDAEEKAKRAGYRIIWEQSNIESIAREIPEHMSPNSDDAEKAEKLRNMNPDVAARSADSCKHVSDKYMRTLWAKALAGEADNPGSFSIRTARILGDMRQEDAEMFAHFCQFVVEDINGESGATPIIHDNGRAPVYNKQGLLFYSMVHLSAIGLIILNSSPLGDIYIHPSSIPEFLISYYGTPVRLTLPETQPPTERYNVSIGCALLTNSGKELFSICDAQPNDEFFSYLIQTWKSRKYAPVLISEQEAEMLKRKCNQANT